MFSKIVTLGAMLALTASLSASSAFAKPAKPASCCKTGAACCTKGKSCCAKPEKAKCCKAGAACCKEKKACCGAEKGKEHAHGKSAMGNCCAVKAK